MGHNDHLDYGPENQRLTMIKDYENMIVIPSLHICQIRFFGMGDREEYIMWKEIDDKFVAVDKHYKITTWSKINGKQIKRANICEATKENHLRGFSIFKTKMSD